MICLFLRQFQCFMHFGIKYLRHWLTKCNEVFQYVHQCTLCPKKTTLMLHTIDYRLWVALNRTGQLQMFKVTTSGMLAATHILREKTHACGVLKRHNFRVHVSLGSAEILVRRGGIINHHSIAYSVSNTSAKNYQNRLMWVESIVCNISVVFLGHSVHCTHFQNMLLVSYYCFISCRLL